MSLWSRLLGRRVAPGTGEGVTPRGLPDGPFYAIGDIHGHLDRFAALEDTIIADARARGEDTARVVCLGDYVDRGPDSAGVLDRLLAPPPEGIARLALRGNHEAMFADFLDAPRANHPWLGMGGRETLASYGLYPDGIAAAGRHLETTLNSFVPEEHRALLDALPMAAMNATHFLCHAGVDPSLPLEAQPERALLWMREPFLSHGARLARIVVHGHSPADRPELLGWRVNADTGAYSGGPLTAVRLNADAPPEILQIT